MPPKTQSRKRKATESTSQPSTSQTHENEAMNLSEVNLEIPDEFLHFSNENGHLVCASLSLVEICPNKRINLDDLKPLEFVKYFEKYKFTNILTQDSSYSRKATLLFYANLSLDTNCDGHPILTTQIGQTPVSITLEDWSECFGFLTKDSEGNESLRWHNEVEGCENFGRGQLFEMYKEEGWTYSNFNSSRCRYQNIEMRALLPIIKHILSGCGGKLKNKNFVSVIEQHLIHFVKQDIFFNLSFFMFHAMIQIKNQHLVRVLANKNMTLPKISFSNLITIYLKKKNVPLPDDVLTDTSPNHDQIIDSEMLSRMGYTLIDGKYEPKTSVAPPITESDAFLLDKRYNTPLISEPNEPNFEPGPSTQTPVTLESLQTLILTNFAQISTQLQNIDTKVDALDVRVQNLESLIKPQNRS